MKETDARRIARIARRIFIDIASTRIAMRMLPGLLRAAAWNNQFTADYTDCGTYENVTGNFKIDKAQFAVKNATFDVKPATSGAAGSLMFDWRGGELIPNSGLQAIGTFRNLTTRKLKQGDATITCTDATFTITVNGNGKPFIDWRKGTWNSGVWPNGIWHNGIWENGQWWYGYWRKGEWKTGYQMLPKIVPAKDKDGNRRYDKQGRPLDEYAWVKDDKACPLIERKTPPTKSYQVFQTTKNNMPYYDVGSYTKGGPWTKDKNGNLLSTTLFPPEAIDALNSQHMSGGTSHDGRNEFMKNVDGMWNGILNPDAPDIYRIYYNPDDGTHRSLYVLYVNGYMKIFHMNDGEQSLQENYKILKPASHRPASLKDLYMLKRCDIFQGFIPTPDNRLLVQSIPNDGKFSHRIIQKAILVSKFKVFDPNALDKLFYVLESGQTSDQKQDEINAFKQKWKSSVENIEKIYKSLGADIDSDVYFGGTYFDPSNTDIKEFFNSLTAMEKLELLLKQSSYQDKLTNFGEIRNSEMKRIIALNGGGCLTMANIQNWMSSSGPAPDEFWRQYDRIMDGLKETGDEIQKKISTMTSIG